MSFDFAAYKSDIDHSTQLLGDAIRYVSAEDACAQAFKNFQDACAVMVSASDFGFYDSSTLSIIEGLTEETATAFALLKSNREIHKQRLKRESFGAGVGN